MSQSSVKNHCQDKFTKHYERAKYFFDQENYNQALEDYLESFGYYAMLSEMDVAEDKKTILNFFQYDIESQIAFLFLDSKILTLA